jgi:hypothetical protein
MAKVPANKLTVKESGNLALEERLCIRQILFLLLFLYKYRVDLLVFGKKCTLKQLYFNYFWKNVYLVTVAYPRTHISRGVSYRYLKNSVH